MAVMLSVPGGLMILEVPERADTYKVGFGITEYHVCRECGVFVAATWSDEDSFLGAANLNAIKVIGPISQPVWVDFDSETVSERRLRKRQTWTPVCVMPQRRVFERLSVDRAPFPTEHMKVLN